MLLTCPDRTTHTRTVVCANENNFLYFLNMCNAIGADNYKYWTSLSGKGERLSDKESEKYILSDNGKQFVKS